MDSVFNFSNIDCRSLIGSDRTVARSNGRVLTRVRNPKIAAQRQIQHGFLIS
jgi:hypothetical protein